MRYPIGHQKPDPRGKGYWHVKLPGHWLANKDGWVPRHRLVLASAIPAEGHQCDMCAWPDLPWQHPLGWRHTINVDHINSTPGDDRLDNLRPLCGWCNANRDWAEAEAPDEWQDAILEQHTTPPWERPEFVTLLAPIWGVGTADLLAYLQTIRAAA